MSSPQNSAAYSNDVLQAPKSAAQAVNAGDLVKIASNLIVPISAATDVPVGVCEDTSPVVSLSDQLTVVRVVRRGVRYLYLKAADVAAFGDQLYATADPQIVTTSSAGSAQKVGRCRELASVTGAAGDTSRILVELDSLLLANG